MSDATPADVTAKPPRGFRWLRIGVSVFFGVLTVAFCVVWMRSYWNYDVIRRTGRISKFDVTSDCGTLRISYIPEFRRMPAVFWRWSQFDAEPVFRTPRISYNRSSEETQLEFPHLLLPLITTAFALLTWLPASFSLRTLLIATTLVAIVLGLIGYTFR